MPLSQKILIALAIAALGLLSAASQSELVSCGRNVLSNGQFDSAITSWPQAALFGFATWSNQDFSGSPSSGALHLVNDSAIDGQNVSVAQCQSILAGSSYELAAKVSPLNYCCSVKGGLTQGIDQVLHTGSIYVLLNFYTKPSCSGTPLADFVRLDAQGRNVWQALSQTFKSPATAVSVRATLGVFKVEKADTLEALFDDVSLDLTGAATLGADSLCLSDGRFDVQANWMTRDGATGSAHPRRLTSDTGYCWFFDPNNVEMIVKVLNGCPLNSRFWAFAGGLTDVQVQMSVTDTATGAVRNYSNPQGTAFVPIQDAAAFQGCTAVSGGGEQSAAPAGKPAAIEKTERPAATFRSAERLSPCVPFGGTLCLNKSRFAVTTHWTTAQGQSGDGVAVQLTPDTGYFWFFSQNNVEMVVKVLDGCGVTGDFWVFAGGLTNVQVEMTVTDTQTGAVKTYVNPQGTALLPIQDTLAFPGCN